MLRYSLLLSSLFLCFSLQSFAQKTLWTDVIESDIELKGEQRIIPDQYRTLRLNAKVLKPILDAAPKRFSAEAQTNKVFLELPLPDRTESTTFIIMEASMMAPELQAKFPGIRTFVGYNPDNPKDHVRFDWTHHGLHTMMRFTENGTWMIDPYSTNDTEHYISYYTKDHHKETEYTCHNLDGKFTTECAPPQKTKGQDVPLKISDGQLRKYRLAASTTAEYAFYHGGTVASTLSALVTAVNRVNEIVENDASVTLEFIANNDLIIYTDGATAPFANPFNLLAMLTENETNLNAVIGESNYDIGHVFNTGNGGLAWVGSSCTYVKARGATGSATPVGDSYYVQFLTHEFGHQLGANHTFSNACYADTGEPASFAAVEPGSGSTIMSYGAIINCAPYVQGTSDPYFHGFSIVEIINHTQFNGGSECAQIINTGNVAPVVDGGSNYFIPKSTPFQLTADASDANGDALTYCWEQVDPKTQFYNGPDPTLTGPYPSDTTSEGPVFRSFLPSDSPTRSMPAPGFLATNSSTAFEILQSEERDLNFQITVRDNNPAGGSTDVDYVRLTVSETSGPFNVTSPNNTDWAVSENQLVQWDVADTDQAPVNCNNVRILLSEDGGFTFPHVLLESTPNDGSQLVTVPNIITSTARIKVEAADNVFFDINQNYFAITDNGPAFSMNASPEIVPSCGGNNTLTTNVSMENFSGFNSAVTLSATGGPSGTSFSFSSNNLIPNGNDVQMFMALPLAVAPGFYPVEITATGGGLTRVYEVTIRVDFQVGSPIITTPSSNAIDLSVSPTFAWIPVQFAIGYTLEIASDPGFTNIVEGLSVPSTSFTLTEKLDPFTTYYWRVQAINECGTGSYSFQDNFTTGMHDYCTSSGSSSASEWIEAITIGSLVNNSGNNGGYGDFTDNPPTIMNTNTVYNFSFTPDFQPYTNPQGVLITAFEEYWRVWIDFNQNGEMDASLGELVYDQGETSQTTVTGSFTIPAGVPEGLTMMRVSMRFDDPASFCGIFNEGEVEDYMVQIVASDCISDTDNDGVCDAEDTCPGGNDNLDTNGNNLPDDCEPVTVQLKIFLEGPYNPSTNSMDTYLLGNGLLPSTSPYTGEPWYAPNDNFSSTPSNAVDWVLVEVRNGFDPSNEIEVKPAILLSNGNITGVSGPLTFDLPAGVDYYFVVRHRNHLDVLTANAVPRSLTMSYDFTSAASQSFGLETQKTASNGKAMLYAGDVNQDLVIQATDYDAWAIEPAQNQVYFPTDMNLDGIVQATDYDVWFTNKSKLLPPQLGY